MNKKKYIKRAKELHKANFRMFGIGHFDIFIEEIAEILEALERDDFKLVSQIYERLEGKRMG